MSNKHTHTAINTNTNTNTNSHLKTPHQKAKKPKHTHMVTNTNTTATSNPPMTTKITKSAISKAYKPYWKLPLPLLSLRFNKPGPLFSLRLSPLQPKKSHNQYPNHHKLPIDTQAKNWVVAVWEVAPRPRHTPQFIQKRAKLLPLFKPINTA